MPLHLQIVTAERMVYEDDVDMVIAPAWDGAVGILPHHAPLLTTLQIGELLVRKSGVEQALVIAGGFLEVSEGTVTVLADFAEHAEEVDVQRAEEARRRAQESLAGRTDIGNEEAARAELRRAVLQLRVAGTRRRRNQPPQTGA
ncbi:MAG TPA: F0F1 ATP synthase subunit epsilon [Chloroflexia bacterium]|jgi:F-type H+-transporting ATPase subunit epsilon|nr:F0F1 ATP synthase subunit epsilon [Chloroflexia bacterium]